MIYKTMQSSINGESEVVSFALLSHTVLSDNVCYLSATYMRSRHLS